MTSTHLWDPRREPCGGLIFAIVPRVAAQSAWWLRVSAGVILKSKPISWTKTFFSRNCPCGSLKKSYECCWGGSGRWEKTTVGVIDGNGPAPSFANDRCYLSVLGNCGSKITREHFVSRSILERITTGALRFQGAGHFFGGRDQIEIGIDSFSAKVLCDKHNASLSVLDTAANQAFSTIEVLGRDSESATSGDRVTSFHLSSGLDIERWMIKVYCGLVAAKKIRSRSGRTLQRSDLDPCLLSCLLGVCSLLDPIGLYVETSVGQQLKTGAMSFGTIQLPDGSDEVGGLILSLSLMTFVLVTSPRYEHAFQNPNWHRHQSLAWNVRQGNARVGYLFTD